MTNSIHHQTLLNKVLKKTTFNIYVSLVFAVTLFYPPPLSAQSLDELINYPDDRKYNELCWLTAHNAFSSYKEGWTEFAQQNLTLEDQFNHGVRSFMLDFHWYAPMLGKSYVALCHEPFENNCNFSFITRSILDPAPPSAENFFNRIRELLEANPAAIITLHLEDHLKNYGPVSSAVALNQLLDSTRLKGFVFNPARDPKAVPGDLDAWVWPNLSILRSAGQRLIIFSDDRSDGALNVGSFRETQYDLGKSPHCEMRGEGRDKGKVRRLFLLNHFYALPLPVIRNYTDDVNSYPRIFKRIETCCISEGILPNFIAVDFVELGDALNLVQAINTVPKDRFHKITPADLDPIRTPSRPAGP